MEDAKTAITTRLATKTNLAKTHKNNHENKPNNTYPARQKSRAEERMRPMRNRGNGHQVLQGIA